LLSLRAMSLRFLLMELVLLCTAWISTRPHLCWINDEHWILDNSSSAHSQTHTSDAHTLIHKKNTLALVSHAHSIIHSKLYRNLTTWLPTYVTNVTPELVLSIHMNCGAFPTNELHQCVLRFLPISHFKLRCINAPSSHVIKNTHLRTIFFLLVFECASSS
jgi:hypothetical protein